MSATVSNGSRQVPMIGRAPSTQPSCVTSRDSQSCAAWVSVTFTASTIRANAGISAISCLHR